MQSKVLIRSFNPTVNGKTGLPNKKKNFRRSKEWFDFEKVLLDVLSKKIVHVIPETQLISDNLYSLDYDVKIKCHSNKKKYPNFNFFYMQTHHRSIFEFDYLGWGMENSHVNNFNADRYAKTGSMDGARFEFIYSSLLKKQTKHEQKKRLSLRSRSLPSNYIFVPLQSPTDFVIKKHSKIGIIEFIKKVSQAAKFFKVNVVFKIHPMGVRNKKINIKLVKELMTNKYIFVSNDNVIDLINKSQSLVVINSGVGFEGLMLGKPVATLGDCNYKIATHTIDPLSDPHSWNFFSNPSIKTVTKIWLHWYLNEVAFVIDELFEKENKIKLRHLIETENKSKTP